MAAIRKASKVPAEWHAWLHYTVDEVPPAGRPRAPWQKSHVPNLTGTTHAYRPPGHALEGGRRAKANRRLRAVDAALTAPAKQGEGTLCIEA